MKVMRKILIVGITVMMTGCASQGNTVENTTEPIVQKESQTTGNEESAEKIQTTGNEESTEKIQTAGNEESAEKIQTTGNEESIEKIQTAGKEESSKGIVIEGSAAEQEDEKGQTEKAEGISSGDNFSVDMEDAVVFADRIKETVTQKDLEALADMTAYPIYVNFHDKGKSVENREGLIALGTDKVFTEELVDSVNQADEKKLSPSKAGFVLTKKSGAPNIVFGLRDGKLAVLGINY